jgi:hypothetical protein
VRLPGLSLIFFATIESILESTIESVYTSFEENDIGFGPSCIRLSNQIFYGHRNSSGFVFLDISYSDR